ncbi:MAG: molybdopterin-dependent oxidoreductase [Thermus sp.]|uniref:molybdopterin-dependent oxidoreductase n=2 Tax=Thermus sp. TaxID=275 RepID=UPI0025EE40AD|nr:molybdopterin-dependent oxidoreductase [Thermus sp.]MCS7219487.1 molybdopterin-dependent oxidoreductase [Thermus sp.]MDW8017425.1 molybdopterin-dependent oxidoreductase [Thermus sp.]
MERFSRRDLLKLSGAGALLGPLGLALQEKGAQGLEGYEIQLPENTIYSSCLQCNTGCPIKVKLYQGVASKIDGSPISPWTFHPHLPMNTPLDTLARIDGTLCPKGQAGIQTAYDPYRLRRVLKRAGPRGSGKWEEIPFHQAVKEIAEGGPLFAHLGDPRHYPGLKELWALRDPEVMRRMGQAVQAIWAEKDRAKKQALVQKFKEDFKEHLHTLIDPNHPDLGPKNNQVVFAWGRLKAGRRQFVDWFFRDTLGTVNMHGHTTVCQGSLYFIGKAMSEQPTFDAGGKLSWSGGSKFYWQADLTRARFVVFVGANIFEGNYGPPLRVGWLTERVRRGELEYAVVDPRAQKGIKEASRWIAPKPGHDAAIALGIIRLLLEWGKVDTRFLSAANRAAARAIGEASWSNATWLVKLKDGQPERLLRASDLGLPKPKTKLGDKEVELDAPVVLQGGKPVAFNPNDENQAVFGELFVNTTLEGIPVKSALQLLKEEALRHQVQTWAAFAGVSEEDVRFLASKLAQHGKKAVVDLHRGASQHTNGFYTCFAWLAINVLLGNLDHHGGSAWGRAYDITGGRAGGPFPLARLHPRPLTPFGISLIRHEVKYEDTTLFQGFPARRPWYPHASDVYQEILPSAAQGYPYPVQILFHYMGSPAYALPGGGEQIQAMLDPEKIPLIVAFDIVVGDSYLYADYIIPDLSYLERWEFHGTHPSLIWLVQPVRQPAIPPIPEEVEVFGQRMPISLEAFLLALAERLGLPGFGPQGFANGMPFTHPDHLYLKLAANLAFGERGDGSEALPEANEKEMETFRKARRHLPPSVFDEARWQAAVGNEALFRRTVYLLNRGGRFQEFARAYAPGDLLSNRYGRQVNLFLEKQALSLHPMTGKPFWPLPAYFLPYQDVLGRPLRDPGYGLTLLTHRDILQTKSRTISNYWLLAIKPENEILVSAKDAERLGLKEGQLVRVVSATNPKGEWDLGPQGKKPMIGKVKIVQGMRPGCISFALGWGHWAYGAADLVLNGQVVKGDPRRAKGVHANAAMRLDPVLKDMALTDVVGGSVVFYETRVNLLPL